MAAAPRPGLSGTLGAAALASLVRRKLFRVTARARVPPPRPDLMASALLIFVALLASTG